MFKKTKALVFCALMLVVAVFGLTACDLADLGVSSAGACDHEFGDWDEEVEATCLVAGYEVAECEKCGVQKVRVIEPLEHTIEEGTVQSATDDEITVVVNCTECGVFLSKTLSANGDQDKDGIKNADEVALGTNLFLKDTDGDGLFDYDEISINGWNTDPTLADTDGDGLSDYDEINAANGYYTDPTLFDTDGDGASDGQEIALGFDPFNYNDMFDVAYSPELAPDEEPDTVKPTIQVTLEPEQFNSLSIKRNETFNKNTLGYMGDAYDYSVEGEIESATVGFEFDSSNLNENSLPTIYAYDEVSKTMTPIETTVDGNFASAEVEELTTYVLLDRRVFEESLTWVDKWDIGDGNFTSLEILLVIDDSGSMDWNDTYYERLSVAQTLISSLPESGRVGVVKFENSTTVLSTFADGKNAAINCLTTSYFYSSGGTAMYEGIRDALNLYTPNSPETLKVMVVLTDGEANSTNLHSSVISSAQNLGVNIYTVGLGTDTYYFTQYLDPLATSTGGKFYYSSDAAGLLEIYDNIGEKIDLLTDSDGDGLCDYYEDNMVVFNGVGYALDKYNPDTDDDGLLDGAEIRTIVIYSADGTEMTILGQVFSDPTNPDSDGDGIGDKYDPRPFEK